MSFFSSTVIRGGPQPRLNCTSTGEILYLVDADIPRFEWIVDMDFGKTFDFNQYVSYTLRTEMLYSYSQMECDFQNAVVQPCYVDEKLQPDLTRIRPRLADLYEQDRFDFV